MWVAANLPEYRGDVSGDASGILVFRRREVCPALFIHVQKTREKRISCVYHRPLEESQAILLYGQGAFFLHTSLFSDERNRNGDMPKSLRDGQKNRQRNRKRDSEKKRERTPSLLFPTVRRPSRLWYFDRDHPRDAVDYCTEKETRRENRNALRAPRLSRPRGPSLDARTCALWHHTATTSPSTPGSAGVKTLN